MAHNSAMSCDRSDGLGVWWDAYEHEDDAPPFGKDTRPGFGLIAWCGVPTLSWSETLEEAQASKRGIDCSGCAGCCRKNHEIVPMRADEAAWGSQRKRRWI